MTAVASQLSRKVGSVSTVMLSFNTTKEIIIPQWLVPTGETSHEPNGKIPGDKILEAKQVDLQDLLDDLEMMLFHPTRLIVIDRGRDHRKRLCCFLDATPLAEHTSEQRMPVKDEHHVRNLVMRAYLWDVRVYRNESNFVVEAGKPILARSFRTNLTECLWINEETQEFELTVIR